MGLSIRAYARHRGISHVAVLRAARAGRVPLEADGTIDPAKADAAWERSTDPGRSKPRADKFKPVATDSNRRGQTVSWQSDGSKASRG